MDLERYNEFKRLFMLTLRTNQFGGYVPEDKIKQYFGQTEAGQFPSYVHAATHAMENPSPAQLS